MLLVIAVLTAGTAVVQLIYAPDQEQRFVSFFQFAAAPASVLLPVLGVLSMTGEWSQRTALTTFALTPSRGRIVAAKLAAAALMALAVTAVILGVAAAGNLIGMALGGDGSWTATPEVLAQVTLVQVIQVLMGAAFGALLLNSPVAIVLLFALPTAWSVLGEVVKPLSGAAGWLDVSVTTGVLWEPGVTSGQWARLAVSVAVWVLAPLAVGTVRVLRREVA
jgi:ABC-type transport system involved in multi-copper enzyme maturation permease subunit